MDKKTRLKEIHQKASSIHERFGDHLLNGNVSAVLSLKQLLELSNSNFCKRSSYENWLEHFEDNKTQILADQKKYQDERRKMSGWISVIGNILDNYKPSSGVLENSRKFTSVPFEDLLYPFVEYGFNNFIKKVDLDSIKISQGAIDGIKYHLLQELSIISRKCFEKEFREFETKKKRPVYSKQTSSRYQKYVKSLFNGGIMEFFVKYSTLGKLIILILERWINSYELLFKRYLKDLNQIEVELFGNKPLGTITKIQSRLSATRSNDGQVMIIHFHGGEKLVYKPRSAAQDLVLNKIIHWINSKQKLPKLRILKLIDFGDYSWHQFIVYKSCNNETEVETYYTRTGELVAILHVLGSTDYHLHNLLSTGEHPILVDNESIFSPQLIISDSQKLSGDEWMDNKIQHSIFKNRLLLDTSKLFYPNAESIAGVFGLRERYLKEKYLMVNTDEMFSVISLSSKTGKNIAKLRGKKVNPREYQDCINRGYFQTIKLIVDNNESFYKHIEKETNGFKLLIRLVARSTGTYLQDLSDSLNPKYLQDGIDRSLFFEIKMSFDHSKEAQKEINYLLNREVFGLENFLVPSFTIGMCQQQLGAIQVKSYSNPIIRLTALNRFEKILKSVLDKNFLQLQSDCINHYLIKNCDRVKFKNIGTTISKESERILQHALQIADNLKFCYLRFLDYEGLNNLASKDGISLLRYYYLYKGISGVLILFASIYHLTDNSGFKSAVTDLLRPLIEMLNSKSSSELINTENVGGYEGIGSIIYVLSVLGELLNDKKLTRLAYRIFEKVNWLQVKSDDLSMRSGLGGNLLVLLKLYEMQPERQVKGIIGRLTDIFILELSRSVENFDESNVGFIDGSSGNLYTCLKLYQFRNDQKLFNLSKKLYEFNSTVFDRLENSIRSDFPQKRQQNLSLKDGMSGWYMAKSIARNLWSDGDLIENYCSDELLQVAKNEPDSIANGFGGRFEHLIMIGNKSLWNDQILKEWNHKYERSNTYNLTPYHNNTFFFYGISGVLYQQLRLFFPQLLPSIIGLE